MPLGSTGTQALDGPDEDAADSVADGDAASDSGSDDLQTRLLRLLGLDAGGEAFFPTEQLGVAAPLADVDSPQHQTPPQLLLPAADSTAGAAWAAAGDDICGQNPKTRSPRRAPCTPGRQRPQWLRLEQPTSLPKRRQHGRQCSRTLLQRQLCCSLSSSSRRCLQSSKAPP